MIYGSYGYTGRLVVQQAVSRGLRPILAGRNADKLGPQAAALNLEARAFSLDDPAAIDPALAGAAAVLHCAGPFAHTYAAMASACLRTKTPYLDITGEIAVFEGLARRAAEAKAAGVMILPGVGLDVVPTDCLAAHLKSRLPTASKLTLALRGVGSSRSRGTTITALENAHRGGMVRKGGRLERVPAAWKTRKIDFGRGPVQTTTIPWGDVSTAYYSTGIPDIEVYAAVNSSIYWAMVASRYLGWMLGSRAGQTILKHLVKIQPEGPSPEQRARGISLLWGEVEDPAGRRAAALLRTPEGYTLTALTCVAAVEKVLAGQAPAGFQTPALAYGKDFILEIEGVTCQDME